MLIAIAVFVVVGAMLFGAVRIRPYITGDPTVITSTVTENIAGTVDLFDETSSHQINVDISAAEYADLLDSYKRKGEKKWVNATVTIDGTLITDAAVRLKGNSTLMRLRDRDGRPGAGQPPTQGAAASDAAAPGEDGPRRAMTPPGGQLLDVSPDDPKSLPLLISFNETVEGRAYQGMTELSVRPGSPMLNESLALSLTESTDQPTQPFTYAVYSVNGGETVTRLVVQSPDEAYANSLFESSGYLYKADASSRFEYLGDDQSLYTNQFAMLNAAGVGDVEPIVMFLRWLDSADDEEFAKNLDDWVDVESLARYVATQNLLGNFDDMSGPGQNYYLWYDLESQKLSVISWDLNMAMTGQTDEGPDGRTSPSPTDTGAPGRPGQPQAAGTAGADGADPPDGVAGDQPPGGGDDDGEDREHRVGNALKTRFVESTAYAEVYDTAYWQLYDQMFGNGAAMDILSDFERVIPLSDGLTEDQLRSSIDAARAWVTSRTDALADSREE